MKRFLFLLIPFLFLLGGCSSEKPSKQLISSDNSLQNDKNSPVDLIQTDLEQKEWNITKWKISENKTDFMDIINAGLINGDRGALYFLGLCYMIGADGITIDVEQANDLFDKSASLGFAPALDKIRSMYLYDKQDLFLMMVYLNLTISAGHYEFVKIYHKMRSEIVVTFGENIAREIERIAAHKQKLIERNKAELAKSPNLTELIIHDQFKEITQEDLLFDTDYWTQIKKGNVPDNIDAWLKKNYALLIERAGQKAKENRKRLENYK